MLVVAAIILSFIISFKARSHIRCAGLRRAVQCCAVLCCLFSVGQVHEYLLLLLFNTTVKKRAMLSQGNRAMPL